MTRLLSWTEIDTAMTCWARWDFAYGGRLAGATLKPKELAPILSEGRAWGAAVAAWHQHAGEVIAPWYAHEALRKSLDADELEMRAAGFPTALEHRVEMEARLGAMLDHYCETAEPLHGLERLEGEIVVKLPSRGGRRASSLYGFQCFLDGFTNEDGERWLVEFKLRNRLTEPVLLERQRQPRWYAWAEAKAGKKQPLGVIVDERLNDVPKPPRVGELEQAGQELVSAARLIRDLDNGVLAPIRNAKRVNCSYCKFAQICTEPGDEILVDSLFRRTEPKRLREAA
jgi:hypothetical protein